jgi:hypothetical protein
MPSLDTFQKAVESRLGKTERMYGLEVAPAGPQAELDEYFKKNPNTAGMVWGRGANGSPKDAPYSVVVNPYNPDMKDPQKRKGLVMNEAGRIAMQESKDRPSFAITPAMQKWREQTFKPDDPYRKDDQAFRETLVMRTLTGDRGVEVADPEVKKWAGKVWQALQKR